MGLTLKELLMVLRGRRPSHAVFLSGRAFFARRPRTFASRPLPSSCSRYCGGSATKEIPRSRSRIRRGDVIAQAPPETGAPARNPTLAETGGSASARTEQPARPRRPLTHAAEPDHHAKSASNLALAFVLLPRAKRDGMSALYAFCREVDDVADEESVPVETRRERLAALAEDVRRACEAASRRVRASTRSSSQSSSGTICRLSISMNSSKASRWTWISSGTQTTSSWKLYCYRVASVVGLLSIEIFGYRDTLLPTVCRLPWQGAAIDQYFARRPSRR